MRTLGRMRGRFGTQPFLVEKGRSTGRRLNEVFLLPRWATRSPPHQSPPVTASPQGEAFAGGTLLQQNAFAPTPCSRKMRIQIRACRWAPKQPHHRNNAPQPPKPASGNERAIKPGVQGACPWPSFSPFLGRNGDPRRVGGAPGALRPEAPGKPRPPEGYAVPYRTPARSRAGNRVAGLDLRWSKTGPPAAPAAAVSAQLFYQRPHPAGLVPVLLGVVPEELPQAGVLGGLRPGQVGRHGRLLLAEPPAEGP